MSMTEEEIREIAREEAMKVLRPLALALKQSGGQVTGAVNKMFDLKDGKK